jgi:hypothetical protein
MVLKRKTEESDDSYGENEGNRWRDFYSHFITELGRPSVKSIIQQLKVLSYGEDPSISTTGEA